MEIFLNAENAIMGRIASYAAKQALLGKEVRILNCEKAVISGSKAVVFERYHHLIKETGQPRTGPYIPRVPEMFFKRMIRGMVPHKRGRGVDAFHRIMCYPGIPTKFKDQKIEKVEFADISRLKTVKTISVLQLCRMLGGRA